MTGISRRQVIKGFAAAGAATWMAGGGLSSAAFAQGRPGNSGSFTDFRALGPSSADVLEVPRGYDADVLISWGDEFGEGLRFGFNCDYTAYFPLRGPTEGLLWVNHEYVNAWYVSEWRKAQDPAWDPRVEPYRSIMAAEKDAVGGSILHVRRGAGRDRRWEVVLGSRYGRRFTAAGPVVRYDGPVAGSGLVPAEGALGTLANCSGGHTPWGTVLSAEENYQSYGLQRSMPFNLGWDRDGDPDYYAGEVQPQAPGPNALNAYGQTATEIPNYGYVVEVDPYTGAAVRHTALGRLHHENVSMRIASDRRVVAYTGDDAPAANGMLFKFVSSRGHHPRMRTPEAMTLLGSGQLYVAQFLEGADNPAIDSGTGRWHPLDAEDPEASAFTTQWVEANIVNQVGGNLAQFRVPRAEDVEILPGQPTEIVMALTSAKGAPGDATSYGVVRQLSEASEDPDSLDFTWHNLIEGRQATGVANPDNIAFSRGGGLWFTSDISTTRVNTDPNFAWHGNNALYHAPLTGPNANVAFRFANAPIRAELTGPTFVDPARTLFLAVQHPGEPRDNNAGGDLDADPTDPANFHSFWPLGNKTTGANPSKPKPSVVAITKR